MKKSLFFFLLLLPIPFYCQDPVDNTPFHQKVDDGYTINYNNVAISEYIRFVSNITGVNFIFNQEELATTITVVSKEPLSVETIMATLTQMLRIQGFSLLQEENNLVIHRNPDIKQPAHLFFAGDSLDTRYPLTTAVFPIQNESAAAIANAIAPMTSQGAQVEALQATNQLIITDTTENIGNLRTLLQHLDTTNPSVVVELYEIKQADPAFLIATTKQLLAPVMEKRPFILTHPLGSANIYIVSNPSLIEKAIDLLRQLDKEANQKGFVDPSNVLLYPIRYQNADSLLDALEQIANSIAKSGYQDKGIIPVLRNAKAVQDASLLFTGDPSNLAKIEEMLALLDIPGQARLLEGENVLLYPVKNQPLQDLIKTLKNIASTMIKEGYDERGLISTMQSATAMEQSSSILFLGDPNSFPKIEEITKAIDTPTKTKRLQMKNSFFLYKPVHASAQTIYRSFEEIFQNIKTLPFIDQHLLDMQNRITIIHGSGSLVFTGDEALFPKIREMLAHIDVTTSAERENQFLSYQPQVLSGKEVFESLQEYRKKLASSGFSNPDVLQTLHTMQWVESTKTLLFTGPAATLQIIEVLLQSIDSPKAVANSQNTFFLYQLKYASKEAFERYLKNIASKLHKGSIKEEHLLQAIHSMKWIQQSHAFLFTGTQNALDRIEEIAQKFDVTSGADGQNTFILYPLTTVSRKMMEKYLDQIACNLDQTNKQQDALYQAIHTRKWIENSGSFMFSGKKGALTTLQNILSDYDQPESGPSDEYFVYKLKYVQGDVIETELENFARNMRAASVRDTSVLEVIDNIQWIKATNSILITGPALAVQEVKKLITQYDVRVKRTKGELHSDFYMYKPQHTSAELLQLSLADIAKNLEAGGLMDEGLLSAIQSVKYSAQTHSLVFTGTPAALQKISAIIAEIDIPSAKDAAVQKIGRTTFLLYKLKNASGRYVMESLQNVIHDLKKNKDYDADLVKTLQNMKYIRETNSILFTGDQTSLEKAKALVAKFDVASLGEATPPSQFFVYKPNYLLPEDLEQLLLNFADHLKDTGLVDPDLYNSLYSVKYVSSTQSLIFTGTQESLDKTRELLRTFDVASSDMQIPTAEIQPIDNTSFLVYKLQYHKGSEIQASLKQVAKDLLTSKNNVSGNLLEAISSVQWLEITNSLLVTGDQETLTRLKELIKNLDVPLKQVFIEILAIQTTLSNVLDFGLDWGSKASYKQRFGLSAGNLSQVGVSDPATPPFAQTLQNVSNTMKPDPSGILFKTGGNFGVIGDVILHKGQSFATLGSLLNALQTDNEVSILLTPKLITQDNRTSTLFIGQNIPFVGSVVQNFNTTATTFQNASVDYRDIGLNIVITPVIGNNVISLDIKIENSVNVSDATGDSVSVTTNSGLSAITTSKTTLETTVHVPNESFLILSGLVNATDNKSTSAVPCLGGLPFIGAAFSKLSHSKDVRNVVFFIRPRIVDSFQDLQDLTKDQENFFRENAGTPRLESDFAESMEAIKSVDDD